MNTNSQTIYEYKSQAIRMLKMKYPQIDDFTLNQILDYSISKRFKNTPVEVNNNYKKRVVKSDLLQISDMIHQNKPILTSYGVMFKRHEKDKNTPFYDLLESFITTRTKFKKKMFTYPKGTEEFQKYNLLQLLAKLDCNAIYGVLGQYSSMIYNLYIAESVTFQGRSCISAAILLFESFLADNVQWGSINEIIGFIDEVVHQDKRIYKDSDILDKNITVEECYLKIMKNCGFNGWYPSQREMIDIWDILNNCTQEDINRLYYRNNIYEFCDNKAVEKAIIYILQLLDRPFADPNKPPKCIEVELNELLAIIKDYVYHPHLRMNRIDRVRMMMRSVSIITDTDSTIVSFDAWYRYVLEKVKNLPLRINLYRDNPFFKKIEVDEFGDPEPQKMYEKIPVDYDFDFYTGEVLVKPYTQEMYYKDPRDNLRHSIINIIAFIVGNLVTDYMQLLSANYNSYDGSRPCLIIMKNEFLFYRALVTDGKKNYATIQELQEGNKVPKSAALDVKMVIDRSVLQQSTRDRLKWILENKILRPDKIDQVEVIKELARFEKEILDSLKRGEKKYYKPLVIKSAGSYSNPMAIQGVKASVIYNTLKDKRDTAIDLEKHNNIDIVKLELTEKNAYLIKDEFPEVYSKMMALMKLSDYNGSIDYIAIPPEAEVPKWIIPFIDYTSIINDNLKNFPISQIGIEDYDKSSINYTNILTF